MSEMWQIKCAKDSVKAVLPFQRQLRRWKDSILGYKREPGKDRNTIRDGMLLIEWIGNISGANVLEIGSGWQPMVPILFSLAGAKVYLTDMYPLMRTETFQAALDAIRENRDEIIARLKISPDAFDRAARACADDEMEQRLQELRLVYLAPCDCRHLTLETGSVDIVMSRAVLEHIPPAVIEDIFQESHRLLRAGGIMLHLVDHSDHWSHRDQRINAVNFLRYPDWLFGLTCINPQDYQNRLRHTEYRKLLESTGFAVKSEERTVDPKCLASLSSMPIAERFRHFEAEDLATVNSILLAKAL
jgi:SAM-dependent methyltransferase